MFNVVAHLNIFFRWLLLAFFMVLGSACSISERIVNEDHEGEIPEAVFEQLKINKTDKKWLMRSLGDPTHHEMITKNVETYTYKYTRSHYKQANALIVFKYSGVEKTDRYLHLVFRDDKLKKYWDDEFEIIQPHKITHLVKKQRSLFGVLRDKFRGKDDKENKEAKPDNKDDTRAKLGEMKMDETKKMMSNGSEASSSHDSAMNKMDMSSNELKTMPQKNMPAQETESGPQTGPKSKPMTPPEDIVEEKDRSL